MKKVLIICSFVLFSLPGLAERSSLMNAESFQSALATITGQAQDNTQNKLIVLLSKKVIELEERVKALEEKNGAESLCSIKDVKQNLHWGATENLAFKACLDAGLKTYHCYKHTIDCD